MYWLNCSNCGKKILSERQTPKMCSVCRREAERKKRLASKQVCPVCGKDFFPKYPHQINCSKKCALKARTTSVILKCENCHRNIRVTLSRKRKAKKHFCSRKCCFAYLRKHRTADRVGVSEKLRETILEKYHWQCFVCGREDEEMYPLCLHHINGNPLMSNEDNLIPLCPRCHCRVHGRKFLSKKRLLDYAGNEAAQKIDCRLV